MTAPFLAGVGLGLAIAVPIGPVGLLCIGRSMGFGISAGIATGLGAATIHATYGAAAALGLGSSILWTGSNGPMLGLASALIMFWLAMRLLSVPIIAPVGLSMERPRYQLGMYTSAVAFCAVNPTTLLFFAAAVPTIPPFQSSYATCAFSAGIFAGSILWWVTLSFTTGALRARIGPQAIARINQISAAILVALGVVLIVKVAAALP